MDHFNATIFDGKLVARKRGFQVSKQKHRGTSFVNSSAEEYRTRKPPSKSAVAAPVISQFTFINNEEDEKAALAAPKRKPRPASSEVTKKGPKKASKSPKALENGEGTTLSSPPSAASTTTGTPPDTCSLPSQKDSYYRSEAGKEVYERLRDLPFWPSFSFPQGLSSTNKRHMMVDIAYTRTFMYPFNNVMSHNPYDSPQRLSSMGEECRLKAALTIGALIEARKAGKRDSPEFQALNSQLCALIKRQLNEQEPGTMLMTLQGVAALANVAAYTEKHDHWFVHMQGLEKLIDVLGGQEKLDMMTMQVIRRADVTGAISAATKPCLPFIRRSVPIRCPNPLVKLENMDATIRPHLLACGVDEKIVRLIASAAVFNQCVIYTTGRKGSPKFDPFVLMEHYYFLLYELLSRPEPLRDFDEIVSPHAVQNLALDTTRHKSPPRAMFGLWDETAKLIESAMRILSVLYVREFSRDMPCGEETMLNLLESHLRTIYRNRQAQDPADGLIDPQLLFESNSTQNPVLIWICVAGHAFWTLKGVTAGHPVDKTRFSTIYQELLQDVLGPEVSADPELVSQQDLDVFQVLDLRVFRGENWDERQAMKKILELA